MPDIRHTFGEKASNTMQVNIVFALYLLANCYLVASSAIPRNAGLGNMNSKVCRYSANAQLTYS